MSLYLLAPCRCHYAVHVALSDLRKSHVALSILAVKGNTAAAAAAAAAGAAGVAAAVSETPAHPSFLYCSPTARSDTNWPCSAVSATAASPRRLLRLD